MISNHDGSTYAHWAILALWILAGALLVAFCVRGRNARHKAVLPAAAAVSILTASVWMWLAPRAPVTVDVRPAVPLSAQSQAVMDIVVKRCQTCHSNHATMMPYAALTLSLNTMQDVDASAFPIYRQVVQFQQMPLGNLTHMTDDERATIARWYAAKRH